MIKALRQRDFALLWLGGLISLAGDWILAVGGIIALACEFYHGLH